MANFPGVAVAVGLGWLVTFGVGLRALDVAVGAELPEPVQAVSNVTAASAARARGIIAPPWHDERRRRKGAISG